MRKFLILVLAVVMSFSLSGCSILVPLALFNVNDLKEVEYDADLEDDFSEENNFTIPVPTRPVIKPTEETEVEETTTMPEHSEYFIPGLYVDTVIEYFSEVVLDAEYTESASYCLVQKWDREVLYYIHNECTTEDLQDIKNMENWLNSIEGFPGMREVYSEAEANLQIYFTDEQGLLDIMGSNFVDCDGAVTYWYENNKIYKGNICYRNDIDQYVRNSVIIEEIYNGMGPVQDTQLRPDSIIYYGYTAPQEMTAVDELILKLLYHPDIKCGMDKEACAAVIRKLYY